MGCNNIGPYRCSADNLETFESNIKMNPTDTTSNIVMFVSTIVLVLYGLTKGFDAIELTINTAYFASLILYLFRVNFLRRD